MEEIKGIGEAEFSEEKSLEIPEYMPQEPQEEEPPRRKTQAAGEERPPRLRTSPAREEEPEEFEEDIYEEDEYEETPGRRRGGTRLLTYIITAAVVIAAVIAVLLLAGRRQFDSYRVLRTERLEDTVTSSYANVNGNILQYGADGARLQTRQGEEIWSLSYRLQGPRLVKNDNTLVLYDQGGTDIVIAGKDGKIGSYTTRLPIVKADVSAQGNVAAILEDGANAWIEYYAVDGTEIAAIKTSIDNPGYPMAVAVSPNGELLAVSYLSFSDGIQKSEVHIYSFGSAGQNQMDNRIGAFEFDQRLVPEVDYLDDRTLVAFRDNGFTVYEGDKVPKEVNEVTVDREICGIFHDDSHIGLLLTGTEEDTWQLCVYGKSGREQANEKVDFVWTRAELYQDEISLYNGAALRVYDLGGKVKFDGVYTEDPRGFFAIGKHRYVVVTETGIDVVQLKGH